MELEMMGCDMTLLKMVLDGVLGMGIVRLLDWDWDGDRDCVWVLCEWLLLLDLSFSRAVAARMTSLGSVVVLDMAGTEGS